MQRIKRLFTILIAVTVLLSTAVPSSAAVRGKGGFIRHVYESLLLREPSNEEKSDLLSQMSHGRFKGAEVVYHVAFGQEFREAAADDGEFISRVLSLIGEEDPEVTDLYGYLISNGSTREHILYLALRTTGFRDICSEYNVAVGNLNERRHIDPDRPMIALTFDDGPSDYTSRILDALERYGQAATFFVVGTNAEDYQDTIARAYSIGCEIGNHTNGHENLTELEEDELLETLRITSGYVLEATGAIPTVIRPPYGAYNDFVREHVTRPLIHWSVDTRDWESRNAVSTYIELINTAQDGDICLMHDIYSTTADAAVKAIEKLVHDGYQLVTVSEIAEYRGGIEDGGIYFRFRLLTDAEE